MLGPEVLGGTGGTPANEEGEADTGTHVCNVSCMQTGKSMLPSWNLQYSTESHMWVSDSEMSS